MWKEPEQRNVGVQVLTAFLGGTLLALMQSVTNSESFFYTRIWLRFRSHPHPKLEGIPVIRGKTTVIRAVFKSVRDPPHPF
jgi:hypothetical protein